jgi:DNA transposition AAA+ family ATPase
MNQQQQDNESMSTSDNIVNFPKPAAATAPIANVSRCAAALKSAVERPAHLDGLIAFYGPAGWGKTKSASFCANRYRAYYVECKSSWTRKAFLANVLKEMGIVAAKTIYQMTDQVAEQLVLSGRPLIVDEMDYMVQKNAVDTVRDIYESSNAAILLIGEEHLERNLRRWERFHSRVLDWVPAEPVNAADVAELTKLYAADVAYAETLCAALAKDCRGSIRRACKNINTILNHAREKGLEAVDTGVLEHVTLYNGKAPPRRV